MKKEKTKNANEESTSKEKKQRSITVKANKKGRHVMCVLNFLRILVIPIYFLLKPFRYFGNRKVKDGPCIYICNHYGLFDPIYVAATTWEGIHFISKREVFDMFLIGTFIRWIKGIPVNRDGNDVRALLDCLKCLKNGEKISIYPEGTRNKTGEGMLPFRHGAAAMAIKAKVPIIPVMMYERPRFFRCTHILVGDPIELTEYYDRKLTPEEQVEVDEKLRSIMLDMREQHKQFLANKKKSKKD